MRGSSGSNGTVGLTSRWCGPFTTCVNEKPFGWRATNPGSVGGLICGESCRKLPGEEQSASVDWLACDS